MPDTPEKEPLDVFLDEVAKLLSFTQENLANLEKRKPGKEDEENVEELTNQLNEVKDAVKIFLELNASLLPHSSEETAKITKALDKFEQMPKQRRRIIERSKVLQKEIEGMQRDFKIAAEVAKMNEDTDAQGKRIKQKRKKKFRNVDDERWKRI